MKGVADGREVREVEIGRTGLMAEGGELGSNLLRPYSKNRWYRLLSTVIEVADGSSPPALDRARRERWGKLGHDAAS